MTRAARLLGGGVAVASMLALGAASQWPTGAPSTESVLRLSWRTEPVRVEECRTLTEEELANVPAHMRRTEECSGYTADYELRLTIDGETVVMDTIAPAGLRHDRPVYVLYERPTPVGPHDVDVAFHALVPEGYDTGDATVAYRLTERWSFEAGRVSLVTIDEGGGTLVRR